MNQIIRYKSGICFSLVLTVFVGLSLWLSRYIPDDIFDQVVIPLLVTCTTTIAFFGAWLMFRHADGLRIRKAWGWTLITWGLADGAYLLCWFVAPSQVMNMAAHELTDHELLIGNLLGWMLLLYPTEALRPQWLTLRHTLCYLLPIFVLVGLDYVVPLNLAPAIVLYPFVLLGLLVTSVRAYRIWCEENFSTLDDIDVAWIIRYIVMVILVGIVYLYLCMSHSHTRGFTQLWLVIFMLAYSTEQILSRRDPWELVWRIEKDCATPIEPQKHAIPSEESSVVDTNTELRATLEQWMEREKPYTNPDFRLMDLRQILPMNRTYLSQFIHNEYGCTFYQFVNRYRIEEAKRLKQERPDMKVREVAERSGFSSPTVFTRTFTAFIGMTPRQWAKKIHSA